MRLVARLARLVVMSTMLASLILAGLFYFDTSGHLSAYMRRAAAAALGSDVVESVERTGESAVSGLDQLVRPLFRGVETVWALAARVQDSTAPESTRTPRIANALSSAESRAIMDEINTYRREHQLKPLAWDGDLAAFGQERADDMVSRDYFSHRDPESNRILLTDLRRFQTVGENLYQISGPAVQFMRRVAANAVLGWKNSPSHNELMLMDGMESGGVAIARTPTRIVVVLVVSA